MEKNNAQGIAGTVQIIYTFAKNDQQQCFFEYDKNPFWSKEAFLLFALEPIRDIKLHPLAAELMDGLIKLSVAVTPKDRKDYDVMLAELPGWFFECNGKFFFPNGCTEFLKTV
jgi:hypothetical protein